MWRMGVCMTGAGEGGFERRRSLINSSSRRGKSRRAGRWYTACAFPLFLFFPLIFAWDIYFFFLSTWLCYSSTTVLFASGNFIA